MLFCTQKVKSPNGLTSGVVAGGAVGFQNLEDCRIILAENVFEMEHFGRWDTLDGDDTMVVLIFFLNFDASSEKILVIKPVFVEHEFKSGLEWKSLV